MNKVKLLVEIDVPFHAYPTNKLNQRAISQIKKWIKETIQSQSFIPLYIEEDKNGAMIEDCSGKSKIRIKSID